MQLTDKIEKIRKKSNYLTIWRKKQFTNEKKCSILRKTRKQGLDERTASELQRSNRERNADMNKQNMEAQTPQGLYRSSFEHDN